MRLRRLVAASPPASTCRPAWMASTSFTRAPQVAHFRVAAQPGSSDTYDLWAISNHFSSTPDARVGQRNEQAAYAAAIADAIAAADPHARIVVGGDLNVFPRPDDPFAPGDPLFPSDQLAPLYESGLANLWDDLVADEPSAAYSYTFQGQAQTLDQLFVNDALHGDLVQVRAACPSGSRHFPIVDFDLRVPCGTLVAGDTAIDLGIPVRGDSQRERDETFGVVALATGGVRHDDPLATATIVNDD